MKLSPKWEWMYHITACHINNYSLVEMSNVWFLFFFKLDLLLRSRTSPGWFHTPAWQSDGWSHLDCGWMKHAVPVSGKWFYRFSHKMVCKSVSCYKSAIMPTLCQFSRDILRYYHLSFIICYPHILREKSLSQRSQKVTASRPFLRWWVCQTWTSYRLRTQEEHVGIQPGSENRKIQLFSWTDVEISHIYIYVHVRCSIVRLAYCITRGYCLLGW